MTGCQCPSPRRPIPVAAIPAVATSLAEVGGVYRFVASAVRYQGGHSLIESPTKGSPMTATIDVEGPIDRLLEGTLDKLDAVVERAALDPLAVEDRAVLIADAVATVGEAFRQLGDAARGAWAAVVDSYASLFEALAEQFRPTPPPILRGPSAWMFDDREEGTLGRETQLLATAVTRLQAASPLGWLHTRALRWVRCIEARRARRARR